MGPLGDQIARGETAAPTGRNKDRARMDEDEVSNRCDLLHILNSQNYCGLVHILNPLNMMKSCPAVLRTGSSWCQSGNQTAQFTDLSKLDSLSRRKLLGIDLPQNIHQSQDHVESRLSKNIIKQARLQVCVRCTTCLEKQKNLIIWTRSSETDKSKNKM